MIYLFTSLSKIHYFYDNGYIIVCDLNYEDGLFYRWFWKDDLNYILCDDGDSVTEINGFDISLLLPTNLLFFDTDKDEEKFYYAVSKRINDIIFNSIL